MTKLKLLYYNILQFHPSVLEVVRNNFEVINLKDPSSDSLEILEDIDIAMAPLGYPFGKVKIDSCPNLKIIASSTLTVPQIDKEYAKKKGIDVCFLGNETDLLATITPTAELTWGLIIAITRKIPWAHKAACQGAWEGRFWGKQVPRMLSNMTLGVVGLGRLGSIVASYGKAFGMRVYYYSPKSENSDYIRCSSLDGLAEKSDIVSIHVHHNQETQGLIDKAFFNNMRPGSYFINTARGAIVDETALLEALQEGQMAGAALDVLADEYTAGFEKKISDIPLVQYAKTHENLIITPHYAGSTIDARILTQKRTVDLIRQACGI